MGDPDLELSGRWAGFFCLPSWLFFLLRFLFFCVIKFIFRFQWPEGVKWELGCAVFWLGKWDLGHWESQIKTLNGTEICGNNRLGNKIWAKFGVRSPGPPIGEVTTRSHWLNIYHPIFKFHIKSDFAQWNLLLSSHFYRQPFNKPGMRRFSFNVILLNAVQTVCQSKRKLTHSANFWWVKRYSVALPLLLSQ